MRLNRKNIRFIYLLAIAFLFINTINPLPAKAASLEVDAESAIIVDAETGKVLFAKKPDIALPPASMTKMMTEYLVWEAIESGQISWESTTEISDYPYQLSANPNFSGIGLRQNVPYTVRELYEAMAINSDNGTTIALAELIAGDEGKFVEMMNKKGEEMGLAEFRFVNSTGLDNAHLGDNYPAGTDANGVNLLSARSAALLGYHLVKDYPESLEISKIPQTVFDDKTILNWNWMLDHEREDLKPFYYEGVDGLKTGFTDLAGYCFTATAERDGKRLIVVVMKTNSYEERFQETEKLLEYGFQNFNKETIFSAGDQIEGESILPVTKGKEKEVVIAIEDGFELVIKADEKDKYSLEYELDESLLNEKGELTAPVEKGQRIGRAKLVYQGELEDHGYIFPDETKYVDLVALEEVEQSNWFMITISSIGEFFSNLFSTITEKIKGLF